jgi:hypothetical protein
MTIFANDRVYKGTVTEILTALKAAAWGGASMSIDEYILYMKRKYEQFHGEELSLPDSDIEAKAIFLFNKLHEVGAMKIEQ